eukprot:scaffold4145_cov115-Isochrysis_galbana.AAC.28
MEMEKTADATPIPSPSSFFKPPFAGGWFQSCVHYNSLGKSKSIESLGNNVVPLPMSALISTSLRADYGWAFVYE